MLAETRFAAGDPEGCLALVTTAGGPALPRADPWSRIGWYELLTRAALAAGRHDAAGQWADRAQQGAARLGLPGRTGLALLARAHVAAVREPARALELALEAQDALAAAGMTVDAARAQLAAARARAASGDTEAASRQLQQAEAVLEGLGAHHLASPGGKGAAAPGPGILTRREYQVAQLVAEGLTNRRIARQLHVTDKTVEKHLSNIFAKLAISSRAALATALAQWAGRPV
jgi:DNA-binding NarL/FixJ family response regulator